MRSASIRHRFFCSPEMRVAAPEKRREHGLVASRVGAPTVPFSRSTSIGHDVWPTPVSEDGPSSHKPCVEPNRYARDLAQSI